MRVSSSKSFLFASAAGLIAVSGAQAAEPPTKAKPVQYVRICPTYGDGFYYIPGTDTCIKVGGYIRSDFGFNEDGGRTPLYAGTLGAGDRTVSQFTTRHRANIGMDSRTNTQYGLLRTVTSVHFQNQNQTESFNIARGFIQWAGFTFGHARSTSDTWSIESDWHYSAQQNQSDTGANGTNLIAYSLEVGKGTELTFGADERRTKSLTNLSRSDALRIGAEPNNSFAGETWPDPHVDLHTNQQWGFWAISLLAHNVNATYYTTTGAGGACPNPSGLGPTGVALTSCGHPGDRVGWVLMEGGELKLPILGPGDRVGYFAHYGQGASGYSGGSTLSSPALFGPGNNLAAGWMTDGVYVNGSQIELTTAWTVAAGYEHYWTPTLSTSITGGYTTIAYDSAAKALFASNVCPSVAGGGQVGFNGVTGSCDPDWHYFQGGVRTQWLPAPGWRLGIEAFYTQVYTAFNGGAVNLAGASTSGTTGVVTATNTVVGARPAGLYHLNNQGNWAVTFRAMRTFNSATQ
jgi:hypothetical protein